VLSTVALTLTDHTLLLLLLLLLMRAFHVHALKGYVRRPACGLIAAICSVALTGYCVNSTAQGETTRIDLVTQAAVAP
jgi:hypothetical protein